MLASLVATNTPDRICVHLLHDESLPQADASLLRDLVIGSGATWDAIDVREGQRDAWPFSERFPTNAWHRVWLPDLLPHLPRVLYLDADILLRRRIDALWAMDLNGHPIAATTQYLYPNMVARVEHDLGLDVTSYFNSGVLLLDLDAWRTNGLTDALAEHVRKHMRQLVWPDQDALNGVLHSQRTPLHPRWNAMPGLWELPMRQLPYTRDEVAEARDDPAIVHFLGPYKPWHYRSKSPYRADWFRYLERTPWRGRKIEGRRPVHALLRLLPAPSAYRAEALLGPWAARLDAATSRLRRHG